ncbi:MAG TPA: sigma-70 family RNA polymerase sigma factor [Acidimicrobiia bacterium]|nr:sigma-70 family RNA polymerase sigma factor [Acidimicrobiia bacterium]
MNRDDLEPEPMDDLPVVAAQEAFETFFRREYRSVLGLAVVLCGHGAVAEELTMDGFEAALRNWATVSTLDNPGAWVRKVVSNASVSRYRRLAADARARLRISGGSLGTVDLGEHADVWEAVTRLPRRQAQTVALFYFEGYSRREIAVLLGISEESVKTHLERARRTLERELSDGRRH